MGVRIPQPSYANRNRLDHYARLREASHNRHANTTYLKNPTIQLTGIAP